MNPDETVRMYRPVDGADVHWWPHPPLVLSGKQQECDIATFVRLDAVLELLRDQAREIDSSCPPGAALDAVADGLERVFSEREEGSR